jgi:hypothetical protein
MMMRTMLLVALLLAPPVGAAAQEPPTDTTRGRETQTLLGSAIRHGGYGAPLYGVTQINGQVVYLRGTRGAWVINLTEEHAINLGIGRYRSASGFAPATPVVPGTVQPQMRTSYGGLELEYVNRSRRLVHFGVHTLIGSGEIRYRDRQLPVDRTSDNYFLLQPGANVNLNVTNWFRLTGGALYRQVSGVTLDGTSSEELSGASSYLMLRFGRF